MKPSGAILLIPVACCCLTIFFVLIRTKQFYYDRNVHRYLKIPHMSAIVFYIIFNMIQILNYASIFVNNCKLWYILSMIVFWFGRFLIGTEIMMKSVVIVRGTAHQLRWKRYVIPFTLLFIISLLLVLILNTSKEYNSICIPIYKNTIFPMIIIHLYEFCLCSGGAMILLYSLYRAFVNILAGLGHNAPQYGMYIKTFYIND